MNSVTTTLTDIQFIESYISELECLYASLTTVFNRPEKTLFLSYAQAVEFLDTQLKLAKTVYDELEGEISSDEVFDQMISHFADAIRAHQPILAYIASTFVENVPEAHGSKFVSKEKQSLELADNRFLACLEYAIRTEWPLHPSILVVSAKAGDVACFALLYQHISAKKDLGLFWSNDLRKIAEEHGRHHIVKYLDEQGYKYIDSDDDLE